MLKLSLRNPKIILFSQKFYIIVLYHFTASNLHLQSIVTVFLLVYFILESKVYFFPVCISH